MKPIRVKLLDPIEGYEEEAAYRLPKAGEKFLSYEGNIIRASPYHFDAMKLVLTPKETPAQRLGLEVGAVYFKDHKHCAIEIVDGRQHLMLWDDLCYEWQDLEDHEDLDIKNWRKVINADGSMVDGDIEWVEVGGKWVTKADLRECIDKMEVK